MASFSEIVAGSSIFEAAAKGDLKQLKAISKKVDDKWELRKICDEYYDFSTGRNVLQHAARIGHFDICKFLIEGVQVSINSLTSKRDTPLAEAVKWGHIKTVKLLIKHRAVNGFANIDGFTPLHHAVLKDNVELMELLLVEGGSVDRDSVDGTPLQLAVSRGNVEAVKCLLSHEANPSYYNAVADTPLLCAVKCRSFECLNLLLEAGANPNLHYAGLSPLGSAAKEEDTKFLKRLLEAKADPNSFKSDFTKPIQDAAMVRNRAAVEILFPLAEQIALYPNWTVDGIIEYTHSEEFKTKRKNKMTICLATLDLRGKQSASNKEYNDSIINYTMASHLDPSNPTWVLKLSTCEARMGLRHRSLFNAQICIRLKPDFTVPYHEGEMANEIVKKFLMACLAFSLDPYNSETARAFRSSLFDYFVWLGQMGSPDQILSCILL